MTASEAGEVHSCPRDGGVLERRPVGPAEMFACSECQGLWISDADLESFLRLPSEVWKLPAVRARFWSPSVHDNTARCPCGHGNAMESLTRHGVRIDVCEGCSAVWLDGGEIQMLMRKGGFEVRDPDGHAYHESSFLMGEILFDSLVRLFKLPR